MPRLELSHVTTYRYAKPVRLGPHRLMLRPRDSHDLRLLDATLAIAPTPARIGWQHDVFGNSVTEVDFDGVADTLTIESRIRLEHFPGPAASFPIAPHASRLPFSYGAEEISDLGRTHERHYPDAARAIDAWAHRFLRPPTTPIGAEPETFAVLGAMVRAIRDEFVYLRRDAYGTQPPTETLRLGSGTCRDFALLMMEAARSLGIAARFVSGYFCDPALVGPTSVAGATHAWVQLYLPGAGWIEFDPTNGIVGGAGLIRVAVVRDPAQASPIAGSFSGRPGDSLGMEVSVSLTRG